MEKLSNEEKVFWIIAIFIGILTTMISIGCCINWYSSWNPQTVGDTLIAIPLVIFFGLLLDGIIWVLIVGIILGLFFNEYLK